MEYSAIVAGTGFEGRASVIRLLVYPGTKLYLVPEPGNKYDKNAIAVKVRVIKWYFLFIPIKVGIGYIKKTLAATLSKRLGQGGAILEARVKSVDLDRDHPRVSIKIDTDW